MKQTRLGLRDLGLDALGDHIGACARASWYKANEVAETNPARDHLVKAEHVDLTIRNLYLENIAKVVQNLETPFAWTVPVLETNASFTFELHGLARDNEGTFGILIRTGGGYAFHNEVFGAKNSGGSIKDGDLVAAWAAILFCPRAINRVEVVYVDRATMEDVTHVVRAPVPPTPEDFRNFMTAVTQRTVLPDPEYEKEWSDIERVARLYADRRISKDKYTTFKETGEGGDWQCNYCPWLTRCFDDDRGGGQR